jgi:hypothetical protein
MEGTIFPYELSEGFFGNEKIYHFIGNPEGLYFIGMSSGMDKNRPSAGGSGRIV